MSRVLIRYRRWVTSLGWPSLLVLALGGGLWFLWPRGPYAPFPPRRLPEAGAAYLPFGGEHAPLYMKPDLFARPSRIGFGYSLSASFAAEDPDAVLENEPRFLPDPGTEPEWTSTTPLSARPPWEHGLDRVSRPRRAAPLAISATTSVMHVVLSPQLMQAGFVFQPPDVAPEDRKGRLRLAIEPSPDGPERFHVFVESAGMPKIVVDDWIRAVQQSSSTNDSPRGFLEVFPVERVVTATAATGNDHDAPVSPVFDVPPDGPPDR